MWKVCFHLVIFRGVVSYGFNSGCSNFFLVYILITFLLTVIFKEENKRVLYPNLG